MVAHAFYLSTQGQPGLKSEFQDSQGSVTQRNLVSKGGGEGLLCKTGE